VTSDFFATLYFSRISLILTSK